MLAASFLIFGMMSTVAVTSSALPVASGTGYRSESAQVQADTMNDLHQATEFSTRSATQVTFTVPDRDGDNVDDTLDYFWTGLPTAELRYSYQAGPPATLLNDVQNFSLSFHDRLMTGAATAQIMDPNSWGTRWQSNPTFGYDEVFGLLDSRRRWMHATRVTLNSDETIVSISARLSFPSGGSSSVTYAIYDVGASNKPNNLITFSALITTDLEGWFTLPVTPTALTAGEYYLVLWHGHNNLSFHYDSTGGESYTRFEKVSQFGWPATWPNGPSDSRRISIYATYSQN